MDLVAGVDIATAEVRAVAADGEGRTVAESHVSLPEPFSPAPGMSEQDTGSWWPAAAGALKELTERLGSRATGIVAVSVSATSGTVAALDRRGVPLGPAITYADQRASAEAADAQEAGRERWASLGLTVQPSFGLPKLPWLARRGPVAAFVHPTDVVAGRLIGGRAPTDWSHALKTGYDPLRREWAAEALGALGIDPELLPEVLPPTELAGKVTPAAAAETGLPAGCQVRLGMTDSCASQLAAGAGNPGRFVSVLGSTLVLRGATHELHLDPSGAVYSHRHPGAWWLPGGASSTGGRCLTEAFPHRRLAELDAAAERLGPARAVSYPLRGRGERFPFVAPGAEGFTLGSPQSEAERYRTMLEGVAFVERLGYERLASLGIGVAPPIAAAGRGSSSVPWTRIRSTVLGWPVVMVPAASTALGACILAAAGTLHPDLASAESAMSARGEPIEPVESDQDTMEESYRRFVAELSERGWLPPASTT